MTKVPTPHPRGPVRSRSTTYRKWKAAAEMKRLMGLFAIAALALAACGTSTEGTKGGKPQSTAVTTGASSGSVSTTAPKKAPELALVGSGFTQLPRGKYSSSDYVTYAAVVKNNSTSQAASYVSLNIAFYDAAGTVVKANNDNISLVLPGQTAAVGSSAQAGGVARMVVQASVQRWEDTPATVGAFTADGVNTHEEQYGGLKTNGVMKSTFQKDLKSIPIAAVYYNAANAIIGGAFTYLDFVPAGGQSAFEITSSGSGTLPGVARTEVLASVSSTSLLGP